MEAHTPKNEMVATSQKKTGPDISPSAMGQPENNVGSRLHYRYIEIFITLARA